MKIIQQNYNVKTLNLNIISQINNYSLNSENQNSYLLVQYLLAIIQKVQN